MTTTPVTSLAWSEQLKDRGAPQQGQYGWFLARGDTYICCPVAMPQTAVSAFHATAFTTDELLALFGDRFRSLRRCDDGTWGATSPVLSGEMALGARVPDVLAELLDNVLTTPYEREEVER